jgi:hypothetical protein
MDMPEPTTPTERREDTSSPDSRTASPTESDSNTRHRSRLDEMWGDHEE